MHPNTLYTICPIPRRTPSSSTRPCTLYTISILYTMPYTPQDTVLFNETLYRNIAYGRPGASRAEGAPHALERIHSVRLEGIGRMGILYPIPYYTLHD